MAIRCGGGGETSGSGRVRALNLTVLLVSGRVGSDDLGYGPGSGFSVKPVQTSTSVTESSAVSVEWPLLKPDWLASSWLLCERNNDTWLKTTRLSVFAMNGRSETGL